MHLGWRQDDLAALADVSQSAVSRAERGRVAGLSLTALDRLVTAMGAYLDVRILWHGERLDRLLDAAHAAAVERVARVLVAAGWEVAAEVSFAVFGERGSIDLFARHPLTGRLLVVEVKSVIPDIQAMLSALDRKLRLAPRIAQERGWTAGPVSALLVVVDSTTARRRVAEHATTLDSRLPMRGREIMRWLHDPRSGPARIHGIWFLPAMRQGTLCKRIRVRPPRAEHAGPLHESRGD